MNGTFQLIHRAKREGLSRNQPHSPTAAGTIPGAREATAHPVRVSYPDAPVHTGAIYRDLMQKFDRVNTRHLRTP